MDDLNKDSYCIQILPHHNFITLYIYSATGWNLHVMEKTAVTLTEVPHTTKLEKVTPIACNLKQGSITSLFLYSPEV